MLVRDCVDIGLSQRQTWAPVVKKYYNDMCDALTREFLWQHKTQLTTYNFVFSNINNITNLEPTEDTANSPLYNLAVLDAEVKGLCQIIIAQKVHGEINNNAINLV